MNAYKHRMINIHPALLPNFGGKGYYGMNVHKAVVESGVNVTGITIHFVDAHYDNGNVILQKEVKVNPGDTAEIVSQNVLKLEHKYLMTLKLVQGLLSQKRLRIR